MKPKIPDALLAARPGLADTYTTHPAECPDPAGKPPSRYSQGLHDQIVANIVKGNRPHVAAGMAGLPTTTFYAWMRMGKEGNVHLAQFVEDVEIACHKAEGNAIEILNNGFYAENLTTATENVKWWLTAARADGYSKEANAKANAMIAEFMARLETSLPPEIFQMVIAAATGHTLAAEKQVFRLQPADEEAAD